MYIEKVQLITTRVYIIYIYILKVAVPLSSVGSESIQYFRNMAKTILRLESKNDKA